MYISLNSHQNFGYRRSMKQLVWTKESGFFTIQFAKA